LKKILIVPLYIRGLARRLSVRMTQREGTYWQKHGSSTEYGEPGMTEMPLESKKTEFVLFHLKKVDII